MKPTKFSYILSILMLLLACGYSHAQVTDPAFKKPNEHPAHQHVRIFEGRLEKYKKWYSFIARNSNTYQLIKKDKSTALLDFAGNKRMLELVKNLVGKNVCIKGNPQYMNKEPFLLIFVQEICEQ
ncbi:MAG: hypothetical protein ACLRFH_00655 [Opitutales bacterium]